MAGCSAPTALPATDNYLAMISEGAVKTGSGGGVQEALREAPPSALRREDF